MRSMTLLALPGAAAICLLATDGALACSGPACRGPMAYPDTANLPANVGGIWLEPGRASLDQLMPTLRLMDTGPSIDLAVSMVNRSRRVAVRTPATLPVGSTLTASAVSGCKRSDGTSPTATDLRSWTIASAVALPTTLGTLAVVVDPNGSAPTPAEGSCYRLVPTGIADITLTFSTDAAPWSDAFVFETLVDDIVWNPTVSYSEQNPYSQSQAFGGSWVGRGVDRVFAHCGDLVSGVSEGSHHVRMLGILPDGTEVTTEDHVVTLSCPNVVSGDGGSDAGHPVARHKSSSCSVSKGPGSHWALVGLCLAALALSSRRRVRMRQILPVFLKRPGDVTARSATSWHARQSRAR